MDIPKILILKNQVFKLKAHLNNNMFSYRCGNRSICKSVVHFNLIKLQKKEENNGV